MLTSTLVTRRLLARFGTKRVFVAGLVSMASGQLLFSQISAGASYVTAVLPGLLFTAVGIGLALPTASIAITAGVKSSDQGLAGALFTTSQQTGAAVGLAVLATVSGGANRTGLWLARGGVPTFVPDRYGYGRGCRGARGGPSQFRGQSRTSWAGHNRGRTRSRRRRQRERSSESADGDRSLAPSPRKATPRAHGSSTSS